MDRILKRRQEDSIDDSNNNKKQKIEDQKLTISITKLSPITRFENLSNDIFYEIFEYLDLYDIYQSLFHFNKRFKYLLTNLTLPIHINLTNISKSSFERFYKHLILSNEHRIQSIQSSNSFVIDRFFSAKDFISKYVQLKTLILDNMNIQYLSYFFYLPNLESLTIHPSEQLYNSTYFYTNILRLPKLKYCKITYETKSRVDSLKIPRNQFSSVEYLIIDTYFSLDALENLLFCLPKLRHLSISFLYQSALKKVNFRPIELKSMEYLSFKIYFDSFEQIELLIKSFFQNIRILRMKIRFSMEFLEGSRWQQLILSSMPNLQVFDLNFEANVQYDRKQIQTTFHQLIEQFNSPFWTQRNWFFAHQHSADSVYFYSTEPYRRKEYNFYWESSTHPCYSNQQANLNSIKHVKIYGKQTPHTSIHYCPNATELTIDNYSSKLLDNTIRHNINRIVPLAKLEKLVLRFADLSLEKLIQIIYFTPNLHTLKFGYTSFNSNNYKLIEQTSNIYHYISKNNQIKNLDLRLNCSLECLQMIMKLFPYLQYLKTGLDKKELEQISRFLFSKNSHHLLFFSIAYTPKVHLGRFKALIRKQNLHDIHMINLIDYNFYIWW